MRAGSNKRTRGLNLLGLACLALGVVAGAGGCSEYKYFDIHLKFDGTFDVVRAGRVSSVVVAVSGADSTSFALPTGKCPNKALNANPLDCGVFEYSSLAESGNMTFTATAFEGTNQTAACKLGDGTVTVAVGGAMTLTGDLNIGANGTGCSGQ